MKALCGAAGVELIDSLAAMYKRPVSHVFVCVKTFSLQAVAAEMFTYEIAPKCVVVVHNGFILSPFTVPRCPPPPPPASPPQQAVCTLSAAVATTHTSCTKRLASTSLAHSCHTPRWIQRTHAIGLRSVTGAVLCEGSSLSPGKRLHHQRSSGHAMVPLSDTSPHSEG